jgi:hypothetical protein
VVLTETGSGIESVLRSRDECQRRRTTKEIGESAPR